MTTKIEIKVPNIRRLSILSPDKKWLIKKSAKTQSYVIKVITKFSRYDVY
jgi:hypothetical protein